MNTEIEINGITYVEKQETKINPKTGIVKYLIGEYVIVRCHDAGVHSGVLIDYYERTVILKDSRRLWYWVCKKNSFLSGVAMNGITDGSKIGEAVDTIILTESCEIIEATKECQTSIREAGVVEQTDKD